MNPWEGPATKEMRNELSAVPGTSMNQRIKSFSLRVPVFVCGGVGRANPIFLGGRIGARGSNRQR